MNLGLLHRLARKHLSIICKPGDDDHFGCTFLQLTKSHRYTWLLDIGEGQSLCVETGFSMNEHGQQPGIRSHHFEHTLATGNFVTIQIPNSGAMSGLLYPPVKRNGTVKAAWPQQCLVQDVWPICSSQDDYARRSGKAIHLHQKLVERALTLVIAATSKASLVSCPADGVDLVCINIALSFSTALPCPKNSALQPPCSSGNDSILVDPVHSYALNFFHLYVFFVDWKKRIVISTGMTRTSMSSSAKTLGPCQA